MYAEWRRYWDVSKPILVEKSPRHIIMTRLLQHWFGADQTFFIVIMRHPLARQAPCLHCVPLTC